MQNFPDVIKIDNDLELRTIAATVENAKIMFDLIDANREEFRKWLPWVDFVKTVDNEITAMRENNANTPSYGIYYNNKLVGKCGEVGRSIIKDGFICVELGYLLDKDASGKGIMTRSVAAFEKEFFTGDYGIYRMLIMSNTKNIASINVAKRLGYRQEGIFVQSYQSNNDDELPADLVQFAKLKSEWLEKAK